MPSRLVIPRAFSPVALGGRQVRENPFRTLNRIECAFYSPFRAERLFWLTQGKPWAKLFRPRRATDRKCGVETSPSR